jgi:hypothetical protein
MKSALGSTIMVVLQSVHQPTPSEPYSILSNPHQDTDLHRTNHAIRGAYIFTPPITSQSSYIFLLHPHLHFPITKRPYIKVCRSLRCATLPEPCASPDLRQTLSDRHHVLAVGIRSRTSRRTFHGQTTQVQNPHRLYKPTSGESPVRPPCRPERTCTPQEPF